MGGISGVGVGVVSVGALLAYAGLRGENPLTVLREIASGKVTPVADKTVTMTSATGPDTITGITDGPFPELLTALNAFKNDKYSQARRWEKGYSDCSSFVGKGLKSLGIEPPAGSTTMSYGVWNKLRKIDRTEVGAGDFIVRAGAPGHMCIAIDNENAIGQQNRSDNVKIGPIRSLMYPSGSFLCLRYVGARPGGKPAGRSMLGGRIAD